MSTDWAWLVSFEAANAPPIDLVTRVLSSLPYAKTEQDGDGSASWTVRVGPRSFEIGLSTERHVLSESSEMAERASASFGPLLEHADARYEILFDATDWDWIEAPVEQAAVRLAALTGGVVNEYAEGRLFGSISTHELELEGEAEEAVHAVLAERFRDADRRDITIERVLQPFFSRWVIVDATWSSVPHPERVHLAYDREADDGVPVVVLTGRLESIGELTEVEPAATLVVPCVVVSYVLNALFWTNVGVPPRNVQSIADVPFRRSGDADEAARAELFRSEHGAAIHPPTAAPSGDG